MLNGLKINHVVHKNVVGGSSMIWFPLVIAVSERHMPGIKPGSLGWHTSTLTNEQQEVRHVLTSTDSLLEEMLGKDFLELLEVSCPV